MGVFSESINISQIVGRLCSVICFCQIHVIQIAVMQATQQRIDSKSGEV